MRAIALMAAGLSFLAALTFCGTRAHAQTRDGGETNLPLVVGQTDSDREAVTVLTLINRSGSRKSYTFDYLDPTGGWISNITSTLSNGFVTHGVRGGGSFSSKSAGTETISSEEKIRFGKIRIKTTETWSAKFQAYVPDILAQVVVLVRDKNKAVLQAVFPDSPQLTSGELFLLQALITPKAETGLAVVNPNGSAVKLTLRLFDDTSTANRDANGVRLPIATAMVEVASGEMLPIFLKKTFASLPDDLLGNKLTDGNLEVEADGLVGVVGFRLDGTVLSWLTVFQGRE